MMTRRDFLAASSAAGLSAAMPSFAFARPQETIRIGLIGCGGRGTGAANDALTASEGVELVAMGDVFQDRLESSYKNLQEWKPKGVNVKPEKMFVGLDAYKKVLDAGVDLVILTTPPCFRPIHLEAAVKAGKHVFMEKPVAVDGEGVRKVMELADLAKDKGLAIVAGTQRRHEFKYREVMKRIHDGAIGDVTSMRAYWNQGGLWAVTRKDGMSDLEWQLRNWLYFTWISGDHIIEQHIHNIDVCLWACQKLPIKAVSHGGRQTRTDPLYGHIYDHFATELHFENNVVMHTYCRQQDGTVANVSEFIQGTKGQSNGGGRIWGENSFRYEGENTNPYVQEHKHLVESIRSGNLLNEGRQVAESTLAALMGRLAAYTGQEITRDQALATKSLMPKDLSFDMSIPVPPVSMPGLTKLEMFL
ncbi:MAG: Gfo/Idh/MocA family oxidoreductase [Armatimonadetes bacterium]|nr:Gfo/Idh/MocA family oxidoreductase [Armatimonadota bacterium]